MANSRTWLHHFAKNAKRPVPKFAEKTLSEKEKVIVGRSLAQFQLGEGSSGDNFRKRAVQFAEETGDATYVEVVDLFIQEENFHSEMLAAFMQAEGIPQLRHSWLDGVFRKLRKLIGLEVMISVLLTAEIIAMSYYDALGKVGDSPSLKKISAIVLTDEIYHLKFQTDFIRVLNAERPFWLVRLRNLLAKLLMAATVVAVWFEHRQLFRLAGYGFSDLASSAFNYLEQTSREVLLYQRNHKVD